MDIFVLNQNKELIHVLDTFESFIWTDRFSQYGDFEIYTPASIESVSQLKENYYLIRDDTDHVMIIENKKIESDVENGSKLVVTGRSLESILKRRIVWNQTNLDGYIQGQIKKLLDENIISPTDQKRKIDGFIFEETTDEYIASLQVRAQFTGDEVYSAIKNLCDSVEIGFKVTLNESGQFVFKLYSGKDRSYSQEINPYVVFSPNFENIINSNYLEQTEGSKNIALVGGEGEGNNRRTISVGDSEVSGLNRRELFVDARDISSETEDGKLTNDQYNYLLTQRGLEHLSEYKVQKSFDGQVEATQMYKYGEDFFMGDIVQLENEWSQESRVRVVEFIYSENQSGVESYPTFEILEEKEME